ncbi:unnamed protein product [Lupinus luteus]|uniref:Uncharacterized protein n=1 Tax=Lupinus luteus TaxID=3873 RepID=A0AAV1WIT8_LUPLU
MLNLRWPELNLSPWRWILRLPALDMSYWNLQWLSLSLVDDLLWACLTFLESFLLLSMLCYFFLCCGCTL